MSMNKRHRHEVFAWGVTALALAVWTGVASAQVPTGRGTGASTGGSFSGGSFGGSSFGGSSFGGSSFSGGSFSGGSGGFVGGGFSGGSFSGGSFSGSSFSGGSFSGSSFSGGSFSGNMSGNLSRTTGSGAGLSGNLYQGVSNTNPFYQSYQEPLALGMGSGSTQRSTFGMPMYNLSQSITGNLTGGGGALGTTGGVSAVTFNPSPATYMTTPFMVGFSTAPSSGFAPPPARVLPPAVASRLQREAQQVIDRSSALPSKGGIRVSVVGPAVVLQGVVSDEHERRLVEGLVRLAPGINEVVNELRVSGFEPGAPRPIPPP